LIDLGGSEFIIDEVLLLTIGQQLIPIYENGKIAGREIKAEIIEKNTTKNTEQTQSSGF
jgi:ArsR family metal-binding transcriptional regulator